jgi:hypothetical protein
MTSANILGGGGGGEEGCVSKIYVSAPKIDITRPGEGTDYVLFEFRQRLGYTTSPHKTPVSYFVDTLYLISSVMYSVRTSYSVSIERVRHDGESECRSREEEEAWLATKQPYAILDVGGEKFTILRHPQDFCSSILF